ncbi:hypothetical protein [Robiginitalea marina]|uniref:Uncharacterized protein n=1 Tax=Robiginitalea marina TaxID=2954105 RepID=A0ABT1B065_9FLAO|nr:hypothetical protein [Robiginitalea marina]MCO5725688.1 hypothetical protein [Robiginitalea marina]
MPRAILKELLWITGVTAMILRLPVFFAFGEKPLPLVGSGGRLYWL